MTPAEYLKARGWRPHWSNDGGRLDLWMRPHVAGTPPRSTSEATALDVQQKEDIASVKDHGSVRYVPTDEQATTSPLCAALAARGVTERDAIEHLFKEGQEQRERIAVLATLQLPAPIHIPASEGNVLLGAALKQAQAVGEAWKALACARCNLLVSPIGERRAKAAADVSAALKRLEDLGIPYRDTLGEP